MDELTPEQQKALALARARARAAAVVGQGAPAPAAAPPDTPEAAPAPFQRSASGGLFGGDAGPVRAGIADSAIKGYMGLKTLAGGLDKQDQDVLHLMEEEHKADPEYWKRTGGEAMGSVAQLAIPGGAVKSMAVLPALAKAIASRSGAATGAIAAGAGISGLSGLALNPGTGDSWGDQLVDKAKKSVEDSALGGVLSTGGQVLKRAVTKMFTPKPEAQGLFDQGVNPTLQQGGDSWLARTIGGLTSGAARVKQRQDREVLESYVKQYVAPGLDPAGMSLSEINGMARRLINADRDGIFQGKSFSLSPTDRSAIIRAVAGPRGTPTDVTTEALRSFPTLGDAMQSGNNVPRMGPDRMMEIRQRFQDAIDRHPSGPGSTRVSNMAKENLIAAKDKFDQLVRDPKLNADEALRLATNGDQYKYFKRMQEASLTAPSHKNVRAEHLMQQFAEKDINQTGGQSFSELADPALEHLLGPAMRVIGETPTQDMVRSLVTGVKRAAPVAAAGLAGGGPAALAMAPAYGVSLLGQSAAGSRFLFGQNDWQKAMANHLRDIIPYTAPAGFATPE